VNAQKIVRLGSIGIEHILLHPNRFPISGLFPTPDERKGNWAEATYGK
jgi:hypothetical protein